MVMMLRTGHGVASMIRRLVGAAGGKGGTVWGCCLDVIAGSADLCSGYGQKETIPMLPGHAVRI